MNSERLIRACESKIVDLLRHRGAPASPVAPSPLVASPPEEATPREGPLPGQVLYAAADHCASASGAKRARPRLVSAFGKCLGASDADLVNVAVAGELIHAASLVHDDVIDDGTMRRGRPTVNAVWDNLSAVLTGDLMFSLAFAQLASSPRAVMNAAVDVLREMSCAAIDEADARGNMGLSLDQWEKIAEGKTGALFGWCGKSVGHSAGDDEAAAQFDECGRRLGVAFQLADDLKDLLAPGGKDRFQDIRNQNPSYPLLWAFAHVPDVKHAFERAWVAPHLDTSEVEALGELVLQSPAVAAAEAAMKVEVEAAIAALGDHAASDGGKEILSWAHALSATGAVVAFAERASGSLDDAVHLSVATDGRYGDRGQERDVAVAAPTEGAA